MQKRNYVKELTNDNILSLLEVLNYNIQPFLKSKETGELLPAIERYEDENGKEKIFVRCIKKENKFKETIESLKGTKLEAIMNITKNLSGDFFSGNGFLIISDFTLHEAFMDDMFEFNNEQNEEDSSEYKFAHFMADKFGDEYIDDYNHFATEYNKKLEEEKNITKPKQEEQEQEL